MITPFFSIHENISPVFYHFVYFFLVCSKFIFCSVCWYSTMFHRSLWFLWPTLLRHWAHCHGFTYHLMANDSKSRVSAQTSVLTFRWICLKTHHLCLDIHRHIKLSLSRTEFHVCYMNPIFLQQFPFPVFWILNLGCLNSQVIPGLFCLSDPPFLPSCSNHHTSPSKLSGLPLLPKGWMMGCILNGWMNKWKRKWVNGYNVMQKNLSQHFPLKKLLINRVGICPYHKCLTGRGVCFMATRAPPQSRNQTLYSSSKIWNNNNNNNHSNTLHLHSAWQFTKSFTNIVSSRFWAFQHSYQVVWQILPSPLNRWGHGLWREQIILPRPLKWHFQGSLH